MEGDIDENVLLDCAVFHASPTQNSYEALAFSKDKTVMIVSGPLDQLALYLSEAKECQANQSNTSFKLQLVESKKGFSWFTKATLSRFLHIVNTPEELKNSNAIEGEMSQLEEAKNFHISLYAKDQEKSTGRTSAISRLKEVAVNQQIKGETSSSDATKNELLRALDLRLTALEDELATSFNRAAGAVCSSQQIYELLAFAEHFGSIDLRNFFLKVLARRPKSQPDDSSVPQPLSLLDMRNNCGNTTRDILQTAPQAVAKPVKNVVSPAKSAQAERQYSMESDESSESSNEDQSRFERSRSLVRSATPRRSASPMRRIQIGRSGSRRSTALTIKSIGYFPARERTTSNRDADGRNSGDEEPDHLPKKPENPVRRMSVQDAISLFESKQKDHNLDTQKRIASVEVSTSTTTKSVLRRWSAGMGDSFSHSTHENSTHENALDAAPQETSEEYKSAEVKFEYSNVDESLHIAQSLEMEDSKLPPMESHVEPVAPKVEEVNDQATTADWSQQKEAELNQMLMKMMEIKPVKQRDIIGGNGVQQEVPSEQKRGAYSQYREKRSEKPQAENAGKQAVKEAQFKGMNESLEQSKAEMVSKSVSSTGRQGLTIHSQKTRRNSSPPVLPKKAFSKPAGMRTALSKTSSLPATRNSWSAGPLPRTSRTPTPTAPSGPVLTNSTPNSRKTMTKPLATQPSPRVERLQQTKVKKGTLLDANLKLQEEKNHRPVIKNSKSVKTKSPARPEDDSAAFTEKPSFYNRVTKKSSVVPLESKPFLKKSTGISPRGGPMATKTKVSRPDDSAKSSKYLTQPKDSESNVVMTVSNPEVHDALCVQPADADASLEVPVDNDVSCNRTDDRDQVREDLDNGFNNAVEIPVPEIQAEEDVVISSAAWVEVEHEEGSASCDSGLPELSVSPEVASAAALSSPMVRHSVSQILQVDNTEPAIIEWGNAENPPSLVYQKDVPKGLKRFLRFARKSKGDANVTGCASPSVYSEGEDDTEEAKAASKRRSDAVLRKAALQAKGYEQPKSMFSESSDGGNSSKRSMDHGGMSDLVPVPSSGITDTILDRSREGKNSSSASSTKATRSFFSLSTFRSNKSSETKLR